MKNFAKSLIVLGVLSFGIVVSAPRANAAQATSSCHAIVNELVNEWRSIDPASDKKTTNLQINKKQAASPEEIAYLRGQVKQAQADCDAGYQQTALDRANSVHALLDENGGLSPEVANAALAPKPAAK